jgi:hypothetical protein
MPGGVGVVTPTPLLPLAELVDVRRAEDRRQGGRATGLGVGLLTGPDLLDHSTRGQRSVALVDRHPEAARIVNVQTHQAARRDHNNVVPVVDTKLSELCAGRPPEQRGAAPETQDAGVPLLILERDDIEGRARVQPERRAIGEHQFGPAIGVRPNTVTGVERQIRDRGRRLTRARALHRNRAFEVPHASRHRPCVLRALLVLRGRGQSCAHNET